jgi:bifunctional UDP-N-acetylglucosamine pyrophosphorylase/glucosamine-1-phosphate N-acetyltransferase
MTIDVIILAAGKGTRMRSSRAKVLHELAGRPLLHHVIDAAGHLEPRQIGVVVGHQADAVKAATAADVVWVEQAQQLGTGHAVATALDALAGDGIALVVYGDVPLVESQTLAETVDAAQNGHVGLVTADFDDPAELGRIVRDGSGEIASIIEHKDATELQRQIAEINSGILAADKSKLRDWLNRVEPNNAQGEYYLTDVIALAVADGVSVQGIKARVPEEVTGVNDRVQLSQLERILQRRLANDLMLGGVTLADPERVDIRGTVVAGPDCFIDVNVVLSGNVELGANVSIGPGAVIVDSKVGAGTIVHAHTTLEGAIVADNCSLGPFARIRPGSVLDAGVKIGNFVETKKTHLGQGSKASHLAYLGDAEIGAECNIGAGAVTCNYDGVSKHKTTIGDQVFVGTNVTMVAPIQLDDGAFIAAGSCVTSKVASGDLAVGRAKQRNIKGWTSPAQRKSDDDSSTGFS